MKTAIIKSSGRESVSLASGVLKGGGVIIYPTETSYGMGADATNVAAVKKILGMKSREKGKPVPVIFSSLAMAEIFAVVDPAAKKLAKRFMPGPLTLVTEKRDLPDVLSRKTVAWRIPGHPFALALAKKFGKPITATSANMSGEPPIYKINDVISFFSGSVNLIIDDGNLPERKPSTIFDSAGKKIIRKGPVKEKDIVACLRV